VGFLAGLLSQVVLIAATDWRPVEPRELALKSPKVEPGADAEAICWDVRVQDEIDASLARAVLWHYLRIKIFTERGRESQSNIDLPYRTGIKIVDISARTIKPNGEVVEMNKDAVFERTILKAGGIQVKAKSFAMPAVEVGSIIEYRWKEIRLDQVMDHVRLQFQRDIPVQEVSYHIKPFTSPYLPYAMRAFPFGMPLPQFVRERDDFYAATVNNMPAFKEEARMPPEDQVRAWLLVYYAEDKKLVPEKYWKEKGKELYNTYKPLIKANNDVKRAATEAAGAAASDDDKLHRVFNYVRANVKNIQNQSSGISQEDREDIKDNKSPGDTLNHKAGTGFDINCLFASMANALGFDARLVRIANRADTFFNKNFPDTYFLRNVSVAVQVGGQWKFFDPASTYVPYGMLSWSEEGTEALISDPKEGFFVRTPLTPGAQSATERQAKFQLAEDGTIEGDVKITYTGHAGTTQKWSEEDVSAAEREETFRKNLVDRISTAEVTNIKIENVTDPIKPITYSYHIKVLGYAQRTGKRIFLPPAYFEFNYAAMFPASERKHAVYFYYPWEEKDSIEFDLPENLTLDHPEAPNSMNFGKPGRFDVELKISADRRRLYYRRRLLFADGESLLFPQELYASLKKAFDSINAADGRSLTFKVGAPPSEVSSGGQR